MRSNNLPYRNSPEQSSSRNTGNLPGFNEIMSEIGLPCPRCHRIPSNSNVQHQCCTAGDEQSSSMTGLETTNAYIASPMAEAYVANLRTEMLTPMSSRSPSISGSGDGHVSSDEDAHRFIGICATCGPSCRNPGHPKKEHKNVREKRNRADQAQAHQNAEDMLNCYFGWKPAKTQSSGNGNAAGVETVKIDLIRGAFFHARRGLERELREAIAANRVEQWQANMRRETADYLRKWQNGPSYDPSFDGSWMELADKRRPCCPVHQKGKDKESKLCKTHPESGLNYIDCRKRRRQAAFQEQKARFEAGFKARLA